ncbi:type IV secretion protein Rhs [Neisseria iguanae]|uniref:Type IV secretion protein Rhs n=1 Tax=Neisseria iguanae TaxID=90242 RepID=A0A2P7U2X2_9NEIS|nr:type IV secretion protein Rhs [Neisseria iguanae]
MSKHWRRLTANEINLARRVFSDSIDYARVKIYCGIPYLPNINVAVAPNGHVFFPRQNCPADFTLAGQNYQMWLIHELTHVWQYQLGFKIWWAGILLMAVGGYVRRKAYMYPPPHTIAHFSNLNMEQQADLIAHYFAARYLPHNAHTQHLPDFQTALQPFLYNPLQRNLLPRYRRFNLV